MNWCAPGVPFALFGSVGERLAIVRQLRPRSRIQRAIVFVYPDNGISERR
jgi:hypothetical protein